MHEEIRLIENQSYYWAAKSGYICNKNKVLKNNVNPVTGYCVVHLRINGKTVSQYVHRIIAKAFIPNPDNKEQVNHKDFNRQNNAVYNLEWCTRLENAAHGTKHRRWNVPKLGGRGSKCHSAKLSEKDIEYIKANWVDGRTNRAGKSGQELALELGVKPAAISAVIHKRTWSYR